MNLLTIILSGFREIRAHWFRSALTMFGVICGVASLITMAAFVRPSPRRRTSPRRRRTPRRRASPSRRPSPKTPSPRWWWRPSRPKKLPTPTRRRTARIDSSRAFHETEPLLDPQSIEKLAASDAFATKARCKKNTNTTQHLRS